MKKIFLFLVCALFFASIVIMGCSSAPSSSTTTTVPTIPPEPGLEQFGSPAVAEKFPFDEVIAEASNVTLGDSSLSAANGTSKNHILSIHGFDLDAGANASSWTFIIANDNTTFLVTYDHSGETVTKWPNSITTNEIDTARIITPAELFDKNHAVLFNTSGEESFGVKDLQIGEGVYAITPKSSNRVLIFDSITGALKYPNG